MSESDNPASRFGEWLTRPGNKAELRRDARNIVLCIVGGVVALAVSFWLVGTPEGATLTAWLNGYI